MNKKQNTAEQSAAGAAAPEKIPAHKRTYTTRDGGRVVHTAPGIDAADFETDHNTIPVTDTTTEETGHA